MEQIRKIPCTDRALKVALQSSVQQALAVDRLQHTLLRRSGFQRRLNPGR